MTNNFKLIKEELTIIDYNEGVKYTFTNYDEYRKYVDILNELYDNAYREYVDILNESYDTKKIKEESILDYIELNEIAKMFSKPGYWELTYCPYEDIIYLKDYDEKIILCEIKMIEGKFIFRNSEDYSVIAEYDSLKELKKAIENFIHYFED